MSGALKTPAKSMFCVAPEASDKFAMAWPARTNGPVTTTLPAPGLIEGNALAVEDARNIRSEMICGSMPRKAKWPPVTLSPSLTTMPEITLLPCRALRPPIPALPIRNPVS